MSETSKSLLASLFSPPLDGRVKRENFNLAPVSGQQANGISALPFIKFLDDVFVCFGKHISESAMLPSHYVKS